MMQHLRQKKLEDTMDIFENNISTLSGTDRTPGFFDQLMPKEKYVPGKENAFADFLSGKYEVDQADTNLPTTSKAAEATDLINVVETRAKTRQKLATMPQSDLEVPEIPEEDKIVDPTDLPNQDQWPFTQLQITDGQKVDPTLDQTRQKVENQLSPQTIHKCNCGLAHHAAVCAASAHILIRLFQLIIEPYKQTDTSTTTILIVNGSPNFFTLITTLRQRSIVWSQWCTIQFVLPTAWSQKLSKIYENHNFMG
uniref:Uncharacterized protein n=1 Tax=Romanomermis culicivorax TaxID=13658 RepID=A0A915KWX1_ROMCU